MGFGTQGLNVPGGDFQVNFLGRQVDAALASCARSNDKSNLLNLVKLQAKLIDLLLASNLSHSHIRSTLAGKANFLA